MTSHVPPLETLYIKPEQAVNACAIRPYAGAPGELRPIDFSIFNAASQLLFRTPGNVFVDPDPDLPANSWFDMVFTLDIDTDQTMVQYSTTVGGPLITVGDGWYSMESAVTNIGRITLNGAASAVNWDDIVITPEPAALALAVLGGVVGLRRRRR